MSYSDMITGLMLIFLLMFLISISQKPINGYEIITDDYEYLKDDLYSELYDEFKYDLEKWHAEIDRKTLIISFNEPEILFEKGSDELKPLFIEILDNFYPRYVKILSRNRFKSSISEIRVEGHTSSEWNDKSREFDAYINNMSLSQNRTAKVLNYLLKKSWIPNYRWARDRIISVGYSSSKIRLASNMEDRDASRRVEFRVITDVEEKLYEYIEKKKKNEKLNNLADMDISIKPLKFRR